MDIKYNYLIGKEGDLPLNYDYHKRPDPDSDGCKKLYDDIIQAYLSDGIITNSNDVTNCEQQFRYNKVWEKVSNNELWRRYYALNNDNPKEKSRTYKPPFYTVIYKDYLLSSDYIGPSIFWAERKGVDKTKILEIINNCRTIGGHIVWPRGCGTTINQARGGSETFYDRIDWTLYLVKLFCDNDFSYDKSLLRYKDLYDCEGIDAVKIVLDSINTYKKWFEEFGDNKSAFCNFCKQFKLIGTFVDEDLEINWLSLQFPILPEDYMKFIDNNINAIKSRNKLLI